MTKNITRSKYGHLITLKTSSEMYTNYKYIHLQLKPQSTWLKELKGEIDNLIIIEISMTYSQKLIESLERNQQGQRRLDWHSQTSSSHQHQYSTSAKVCRTHTLSKHMKYYPGESTCWAIKQSQKV